MYNTTSYGVYSKLKKLTHQALTISTLAFIIRTVYSVYVASMKSYTITVLVIISLRNYFCRYSHNKNRFLLLSLAIATV